MKVVSSNPMIGRRVFIFEFVSGGGFNKDDIPVSLFCEGFGMLFSIIKDFKSLNFEIYTLLDYRIQRLSANLIVNKSVIIKKDDDFLNQFENCVKNTDYSFIIAPESDNILFNLSKIVKKHHKILLSTNIEGIKIGSSKMKTHSFFQKNKLLTPKTYLIPFKQRKLDLEFIVQKFDDLKKPIIIKPEDGVGAESIYLFETSKQIKNFFHRFHSKIEINRNYILQEYISGKDLSISLINKAGSLNRKSKNPLLLSINSQYVNIKNSNYNSEYFGGYTPVKEYQRNFVELTKILKNVDFSSFSGYFGIDLIKSEDLNFYFIEINPRLTTSYIGIRNILRQNPAKLILDSKLNLLKPEDIRIQYFSIFTKIEFSYLKSKYNNRSKEELMNKLIELIPEFVTPPISLNGSNQFTCFIATKTEDINSSKKRIQEIKHLLQSLNFRIVK